MNKRTTWISIVIVIILVIIAIGYSTNSKNGTIRIGAVLPMTGPAGSVGDLMKTGLQWKIDELKEAGRKIDFIIEDSQSDPKQAVNAFTKLVNVDGLKIIFTTTSGAGMALKPVAEADKVLLWGDITHPGFTKDSKFLLRHSNIVDQQTKVTADHIIAQGFKNVGVLYQQDDFGVAYNSYLIANLKAAGIKTTSESVDAKSPDYRTQITKIKATNADAIVMAIVGQGSAIMVKQINETGYKGALYQSVGFILTPAAQTMLGSSTRGMFYEGYDDNQQFISEYTTKFGKNPPTLGVMGYTDVELLVSAIDKTGSTDPATIISYIKSLGSFTGRFETVNITSQGDIVIPTIVKVW